MSRTGIEQDIAPVEARRMLSTLCEQNHRGELCSTAIGDAPVRAEVRFLQLSGDTLAVDYPVVDGEPLRLAKSEAVELRFVWKDQFYSFVAPVKERVAGESAGRASMDMLVLELPEGMERVQRRRSFRVSLLDLPAPSVTFTRTSGDGESLGGALVELSETGGRVMVADALLPMFEVNQTFNVSFEIPDEGELLTIPARVERSLQYADDGVAMIGISWQLDQHWSEARRTLTRLSKFLVAQQRIAIRRAQ